MIFWNSQQNPSQPDGSLIGDIADGIARFNQPAKLATCVGQKEYGDMTMTEIGKQCAYPFLITESHLGRFPLDGGFPLNFGT